jgi:hypothetical protein
MELNIPQRAIDEDDKCRLVLVDRRYQEALTHQWSVQVMNPDMDVPPTPPQLQDSLPILLT